VADDLRSIFYASSKQKVMEFFEQVKKRWSKDLSSAVAALERSLKPCLTFFNFSEGE
jgi:transposase-like protein